MKKKAKENSLIPESKRKGDNGVYKSLSALAVELIISPYIRFNFSFSFLSSSYDVFVVG
jgi:hypothetical protein